MWQRPRRKQLVEIFFSFDYYDVDLFYFIYLFFGRWSTFCICNVPKIHRTNKKNKKRKGCLPRGWHGFGPNGVPWYHVVPWLCLEKLVGIFLFFSFFGDHEFMILKKIIIIIIINKKKGPSMRGRAQNLKVEARFSISKQKWKRKVASIICLSF